MIWAWLAIPVGIALFVWLFGRWTRDEFAYTYRRQEAIDALERLYSPKRMAAKGWLFAPKGTRRGERKK